MVSRKFSQLHRDAKGYLCINDNLCAGNVDCSRLDSDLHAGIIAALDDLPESDGTGSIHDFSKAVLNLLERFQEPDSRRRCLSDHLRIRETDYRVKTYLRGTVIPDIVGSGIHPGYLGSQTANEQAIVELRQAFWYIVYVESYRKPDDHRYFDTLLSRFNGKEMKMFREDRQFFQKLGRPVEGGQGSRMETIYSSSSSVHADAGSCRPTLLPKPSTENENSRYTSLASWSGATAPSNQPGPEALLARRDLRSFLTSWRKFIPSDEAKAISPEEDKTATPGEAELEIAIAEFYIAVLDNETPESYRNQVRNRMELLKNKLGFAYRAELQIKRFVQSFAPRIYRALQQHSTSVDEPSTSSPDDKAMANILYLLDILHGLAHGGPELSTSVYGADEGNSSTNQSSAIGNTPSDASIGTRTVSFAWTDGTEEPRQ